MRKLILSLGVVLQSFIGNTQVWSLEQTSVPSSYTSPIKYGYSISIDSNYTVIGSPGISSNAGAVFILMYDGVNWNTIAMLTASDGEPDDQFGISVDIYGDVIVVGAMGDDDSGTDAGAVYVFEKPITGWANMTETAKLLASDGEANDILGKSLKIYQDDIVVGAHLDDDNGTDAGAVYVYTKPMSGWSNMTETAKLLPSDGAPNESFGHSVSIYQNTIVIGAQWDDDNGAYSGSAYVFEKPISGWTNVNETAKLLPSNGTSYNYFANFIDIYGNDIIVGSGANQGYVYTKPVSGWSNMTETAILTASDGPIDWFANAVSIYGGTIVLGAERDDISGTDDGSVYVYTKPISGWITTTENQKIVSVYNDQDDYFGHSVSVFDNLIAVGAFNKDILFGFTVGAAYLFKDCKTTVLIDTMVCNSFTSTSGNIYTSTQIINDTLINQNGCDSIVTINLIVNYSDTTIDVVTACDSLVWLDGNVYYNDNNTATYVLTNQNGCDSVIILDLTINNIDVSVTQNSTILTANNSNGSYQWIDCDNGMAPISNETSQTFIASINGNYAVIITENSCTDTSSCYEVTDVGILEPYFTSRLTIFPNPTSGKITIDLGQISEEINVTITNLTGETLELLNFIHKQIMNIDLNQPNGIYFIIIQTKKGQQVVKVIKD